MQNSTIKPLVPNDSLMNLRSFYHSLKNIEMKDDVEIEYDLAKARGIYLTLQKLGLEQVLKSTEKDAVDFLQRYEEQGE